MEHLRSTAAPTPYEKMLDESGAEADPVGASARSPVTEGLRCPAASTRPR